MRGRPTTKALFTLKILPWKLPGTFGRSVHTTNKFPGNSLFLGNNYPCSGVGLKDLTPGKGVFYHALDSVLSEDLGGGRPANPEHFLFVGKGNINVVV